VSDTAGCSPYLQASVVEKVASALSR
jgi:hypothetical protein